VYGEPYRGFESLPLRQFFHLPGKELAPLSLPGQKPAVEIKFPQPSKVSFCACFFEGTFFEGSAIKQTFSVNAGSILTFDWNYLSQEQIDFAFVVLDGTTSLLVWSANLNSGTPFLYESGYHTFATTLATSGSHTTGIGVVDGYIDWDGNSPVLVDNFSVQKVPEPASLFLMALGLILMVRMGNGSPRSWMNPHSIGCHRSTTIWLYAYNGCSRKRTLTHGEAYSDCR
jgi:hypothetical protein